MKDLYFDNVVKGRPYLTHVRISICILNKSKKGSSSYDNALWSALRLSNLCYLALDLLCVTVAHCVP